MPPLDPDSILVLVDPKGDDAQAAFHFWQNAKHRRFGRAKDAPTEDDDDTSSDMYLGSQDFDPDASVPVHLRLSFDMSPKDPSKGFVFGSDSETCDILLAENKDSVISGNHFSINVDWQTGNPLITCLTPTEGSTGIRILTCTSWTLYLHREWKVLDPGRFTTVKIYDEMQFVVYNLNRKNREAAYSKNLQRYLKKCQDAVPALTNLRLFDPEPTPLLVNRGRGLTGMEYFTTSTKVLEKVVLCEAKSHQNWTEDSPSFVVKRFRSVKYTWPPHATTVLRKLGGLRHRHIIVPEVIITDGTEYMPVYLPEPPETLAERHTREPLMEIDVAEVLAQVFEGLKFLHANDIVHGGLYPGNIRIKHSGSWSIRLSDIGIHPFADLEDSKERALYASQAQQGQREPVMDTWSAGVVGLKLLSPNGLPLRSTHYGKAQSFSKHKQSDWTRVVAREANSFYASVTPGAKGKKDAALFLTRVLRYEFEKRLTAEECLQDKWIKCWQLPLSYNRADSQDPSSPFFYDPNGPLDLLSEEKLLHEEAEHREESGEETETEKPRTSTLKGKQRQIWRPTSVASSSRPDWHRSAVPQSLGYSEGSPTGSRHTSVEPTDSVSRQASVAPLSTANHEEHVKRFEDPSAGPSSTMPPNRVSDWSAYDSFWSSRQGEMNRPATYPRPNLDAYMGFAHCGSNTSSQVSDERVYAAVDARPENTGTQEEQPTVRMKDAFPSILDM